MIVIFHQDWPGDLERAAHYYEEQAGRELRQDFIHEAFATIERIKTNPLAFMQLYGPVRRARLKRFRFHSIRFRFIDETNTLRILGIIHASRHPDTAKDRR